MATVRPFKAIRPCANMASQVAALPYDVMSSSEAREMAKDNEYSFLHVDKAEIDLEEGIDIYDSRVYEKAAENLNQMIEKAVFIQDTSPSYYIYRLTMSGRSQTGLVACTAIDDYIEGRIKKHEFTRQDKEQDRIRHIEVCDANTGPIFLTYKASELIDNLVYGCVNNLDPIYDFVSEDNIRHEVWVIETPERIEAIEHAFENVDTLYIADGHHRNAAAVKVGLKRREQEPGFSAEDEFNYYLAVLFPDKELFIMDYNRVVKDLNGLSTEEFLNRVSEKFDVAEAGDNFRPSETHTFGLYIDKKWYMLKAKPSVVNEDDPISCLDVSILQNEILADILGINDPRTDKRIDFVGGIRGAQELVRLVDEGGMRLAFLMHATTMQQLMDIADADKTMPPKSTWFEPKLRSGLFIHKLI